MSENDKPQQNTATNDTPVEDAPVEAADTPSESAEVTPTSETPEEESVVPEGYELTEEEKEEVATEESQEATPTAEADVEDAGDAEETEVSEEEPSATAADTAQKIQNFRPGDTIRILYRIIEGKKVRTQPYEGIVISKKGSGQSKTFTVRRIGAHGIGVERIFPLHSPNIEKLTVVKRGKVRKAKLYYLRGKKGRAAMRIRERAVKKTTAAK
jgi:large subunit ribosomal protein L19